MKTMEEMARLAAQEFASKGGRRTISDGYPHYDVDYAMRALRLAGVQDLLDRITELELDLAQGADNYNDCVRKEFALRVLNDELRQKIDPNPPIGTPGMTDYKVIYQGPFRRVGLSAWWYRKMETWKMEDLRYGAWSWVEAGEVPDGAERVI